MALDAFWLYLPFGQSVAFVLNAPRLYLFVVVVLKAVRRVLSLVAPRIGPLARGKMPEGLPFLVPIALRLLVACLPFRLPVGPPRTISFFKQVVSNEDLGKQYLPEHSG